ncbi:hypothetical protein BC351_26660 [Paenibacillus ferrarius]|uniref:Uncharacterized protein n=1 Tax=Paenibacillus ferrarius TaxID=1469647 RepID=A0A1V4HJF1_9BACL|nr:hypothetical protein [Paenibacillus ferrarius]OPH56992.1 hypothetical protein BC351_26660 [Paenibacillus ferrarius]
MNDEDYGRINLSIISEDKKLIVSYHVAQSEHNKTPHIVIQGQEFVGLENHYRQGWVRVQTPSWDDHMITPGLVRTIIDGCLLPKDQLIFVDWEGNLI